MAGDGIVQEIRERLSPLVGRLAQLDDEIDALQHEVMEKREERKVLRKALVGVGAIEQELKPPKKSKSYGGNVSEATLAKVRETFASFPNEFNVADAVKRSGFSDFVIRNAIERLRRDNEVRLVGARRISPHSPVKSAHYVYIPQEDDANGEAQGNAEEVEPHAGQPAA